MWVGVPFDDVTDVRVATSSSSDICRIEVDYFRNVEAQGRPAMICTISIVDTESLEASTTPLTPTMPGNLAYSADVRASRLEDVVLTMIVTAIDAPISPIRE